MKKIKDRCIIINALPRTGSNILWNIVSSHPDISMPRRETGDMINGLGTIGRLMRSKWKDKPISREFLGQLFKLHLNLLKVGYLNDNDHNEKYPNQKYTAKEVKNTAVCIKSMGDDFLLNDFIATQFRKTHVIGLVRNGYAFCESMERRGYKPTEASQLYSRFAKFVLEQHNGHHHFMMVRFEELLSEPFTVASAIFEFLELNPINLDQLRLKSKRVLNQSGSHEVRCDKTEGRHYWFDRGEIRSFLADNVDDVQIRALSHESRAIFASTCGEDMRKLGYQL